MPYNLDMRLLSLLTSTVQWNFERVKVKFLLFLIFFYFLFILIRKGKYIIITIILLLYYATSVDVPKRMKNNYKSLEYLSMN